MARAWHKVQGFLAGALFVIASAASHAETNFAGKTVTIAIGYGVGGSYHFYAQLFSHHLGKFLPGQPAVIVQSMPGAGGVRLLNEASTRARNDGTYLFLPPDTTVITQLLQPEGLLYDARTFRYIGTADQQNTFWVVRRSADASIEGMRRREIFMGSSGKGSTGYMVPALAGPLLGLKIKPVGGYDSSREVILAMEKAEIDGTLQAWQVWKQSRPSWFEPGGTGVPLIQVGASPEPDAPPTPLLRDLVAEQDRPLASLFDTIGIIGRSLAAPPGTPQEIVDLLRHAFAAMLIDQDYVAEASKTHLRILPKSGVELEQAIDAAFKSSSADVLKRAQELTR